MRLQNGAFSTFQNMYHSERLGTFLEGKWPNTDSFLYLCSPQKLAQAGLEYYADGQARCVICLCIVTNLEPTSDPWICHANSNADCPLILLGKRVKPDDYTMTQWIDLLAHRRAQLVEHQFRAARTQAVKRISNMLEADWSAEDIRSEVSDEIADTHEAEIGDSHQAHIAAPRAIQIADSDPAAKPTPAHKFDNSVSMLSSDSEMEL